MIIQQTIRITVFCRNCEREMINDVTIGNYTTFSCFSCNKCNASIRLISEKNNEVEQK